MNVNIDEALRVAGAKLAEEPWDLSIEIAGTKYATREITDADAATLLTIAGAAGNGAPIVQMKFVAGLFNDPKPPVETMTPNARTLIVGVVMGHWKKRTERLMGMAFDYALAENARQEAAGRKTPD